MQFIYSADGSTDVNFFQKVPPWTSQTLRRRQNWYRCPNRLRSQILYQRVGQILLVVFTANILRVPPVFSLQKGSFVSSFLTSLYSFSQLLIWKFWTSFFKSPLTPQSSISLALNPLSTCLLALCWDLDFIHWLVILFLTTTYLRRVKKHTGNQLNFKLFKTNNISVIMAQLTWLLSMLAAMLNITTSHLFADQTCQRYIRR